jgi:hypothetical protein
MRKLVTITVLLCAACGTSSVSVDDYPDALRDAFCGFLARCGEVKDVATCRTSNIGIDVHVSASEHAAIDMGRTRFDGARAQACADALGARSCDQTSQSNREVPDACLAVVAGTATAGATCALDEECVSLVCHVPSCAQACCTGTCEGGAVPARAKAGESCETNLCDAASFCDNVATTCVALKKAGDSCESSEQCDFALDCLQGGTCGSLPRLGDACTGACRDVGTTCSLASHTCVKVGLLGEACSSSADCSQLYTCDTSKRCSEGLAVGAPCTIAQRCAGAGAFCDAPVNEVAGLCAVPKANGAACQRDPECQSHACDATSKLCVADAVCL